jgi:hypothetical protein
VSNHYREVSQLLEQCIIDLETTAEAIYRQAAEEQERDGRKRFARLNRRAAAAARRREKEAKQRLAQLASTRPAGSEYE